MPPNEQALDMAMTSQPPLPAGPFGVSDPLQCDFAMPLRARYFPMGFPVDVETNSVELLSTAANLWSCFPQLTETPPVTFRVAVSGRSTVEPRAALPRGQEHLVTIVHSPENFAIADLASAFGFAWLTQDIAADAAYCRYYFLEPLVYVMLTALYLTPLHASCISLNDRAVVLCGDSGAGKTSLGYACARRGWRYLADDAAHIVRSSHDHSVVGRPYTIRFRESARWLFPELNRFTASQRPSGKIDFEIETHELGLSIALKQSASNIVFLRREQGRAAAHLRPFPREEAERRLAQVICFGNERIRSEQQESIRRFVTLPISELIYSDLESAELALRSLAADVPG
jgi:hypothetical protein